jgi:hypothetical protein
MLRTLTIIWILHSTLCLLGDVKSNKGVIKFDINGDRTPEMALNTTGLGVGTSSPSTNLHVNGNAIVTQSLSVGGTGSLSSNLNVYGTIAYSNTTYSTGSHTIGNESYVLADTSTGNVTLVLPDSTTATNKVINIKKISANNRVTVVGAGNLIDQVTTLILGSGNYEHIQLLSSGGKWHVTGVRYGQSIAELYSSNILAHWQMEETFGNTAQDSATYNNDGTLTNSHNFSGNTNTGKVGNALKLDGTNDLVQKESLTLGNHYTYAMWIKSEHGTNTSITSIPHGIAGFCWGSGNAQLDRAAYHKASDDSYVYSPINTTLSANIWYHISAVYDGSTLTSYLNGVAKSSNTITTWKAGAGNLNLSHPGTHGNLASGVHYDDFRYYNRPLTADEILSITQAGAP